MRPLTAMLRERLNLATLALLLATCGSQSPTSTATPSVSSVAASPTSSSPSPSPRPQLATADSRYGRIIVDGSGRTLYLFDLERDANPRCYDACAVSWPPLLATTATTADSRLSQALITVSQRKNGSKQLAYNGHPLYYYAGDRSPGVILCQAVFEYGGGWYVIDTNGNKITTR